MDLVAVTASLLILTQADPAGDASYAEALRCAGLTQAASELEGGESAYGRSLADAALYWTLLAIQASQSKNLSPVQAEAAQTQARRASVRALTRGEAEARRQLQQCRRQTPRMG